MATATSFEINKFLEDLRGALIGDYNAKHFKASGDWARSATIDKANNTLSLAGYTKYISNSRDDVSWKGVGPFKNPKAIGRGMIDDLEQWIFDKGIRADNPRSMAWAIATNIAKFGTKLYQGKRTGIEIEKILNRVLDDHMPEIADAIFQDVLKESGL